MNTTGCPNLYARDDIFGMGLDPDSIGCGLSIVAFTVLFSVFNTIMLALAVMRTYVILRNRRRKSQKLVSKASWLSLVGLFQTWATCIVYMSILVIFYTNGSKQNAFVILLGLECLFYGICVDLWIGKLIRLGTRIIAAPKNKLGTTVSVNGPGKLRTRPSVFSMVVDNKTSSDFVLTILIGLNRIVVLLVALFLCVLSMIYDSQRAFLKAGVGLQCLTTFLDVTIVLWQYHRCEQAMLHIAQNVQGKSTARADWLDQVRFKFRSHRLVICVIGLPASFAILLWSVEVFAINYIMLIFFGAFDSSVNGVMLITFAFSRKRAKGGPAVVGLGLDNTNMTSSPATRDIKELTAHQLAGKDGESNSLQDNA